MQYDSLASEIANVCHDELFENRRGVTETSHPGGGWLLAYYNNNPYAKDDCARPRETERIIARLDQAGYRVIGRGLCDDSYTEVLLIDSEEILIDDASTIICSIVDQEAAKTFGELSAA